jgi:hypothetical protein
MTLVAVAPNKYSKGFKGTEDKIPSAYQVLDLREALERVYRTDAHLVAYVVDGAVHQPRINKSGISSFPESVSVGVFFCDIDNPGHGPWTEELHEAAIRDYETIAELQTAGVYHTAHGRRIVQPIAEPIKVADVEPYLAGWLLGLERAGLCVDWDCKDWTRHFRLPHVRRDGISRKAPFLLLDRMRPIEPPPPVAAPEPAKRASSRRTARPEVVGNWSDGIDSSWEPLVKKVAEAIRAVTTEWHMLFLALAGALLSRGAPPEQVPALVRSISLATGADSKTASREAGARTTVQRWLSAEPCTGFGELSKSWPSVASALALGAPAPSLTGEPPVERTTLDKADTTLLEAIRQAPDGLTLIAAECGLGKTAAAIEVAVERAGKPYASANAKGTRAPAQSKTAISVDKNTLAQQVVDELAKKGVAARRLFGPLSCKDEQGNPICQIADVARPLVEGGQPMQWELCRGRDMERCPHYEGCTARDGIEGPSDARVIVGTHSLLSALDAEAGSTGLLVIDEPPALLETVVITGEDLDGAERCLGWFDGRFGAAMLPALQAVRAWTARVGDLEVATAIHQAIQSSDSVVLPADLAQARRSAKLDESADAVACAMSAPLEEKRGKAPPISYVYLRMARDSAEKATRLGAASRVLRTIHHALCSETPVAVRVELRAEERVFVVTQCNEQLAKVAKRQGAVVVTDANAELHRPILRKVVGYEPRLHRFAAIDGAPITRTLQRWPSANRKSWLRDGRLEITEDFIAALESLFAWAVENPVASKLGIITLRPIEMALRAARGEPVEGAWEPLDDARVRLGYIVRAWPGEIVWGHYGAVRGLNSMADVDCLATLGDPWPNLGLVRSDVAFLGLAEMWEPRMEAMCKAELEQAHGRIRAVHRTKPGRALHIGNVMPSGSGWTATLVDMRDGPTKQAKSAGPAELWQIVSEIGGIRAAAALAGVEPKTMARYVTAERAIPADIFRELLSWWQGDRTAGPIKNISLIGLAVR